MYPPGQLSQDHGSCSASVLSSEVHLPPQNHCLPSPHEDLQVIPEWMEEVPQEYLEQLLKPLNPGEVQILQAPFLDDV